MQFRIQGLIAITVEAAAVFAFMKWVRFQDLYTASMFLILLSPTLIRPLVFFLVSQSKRHRASFILHLGILAGSTVTFGALTLNYNDFGRDLVFGALCYVSATLLIWAPQIYLFWYVRLMYVDGLRSAGIYTRDASRIEPASFDD
ncbi:MAG: hypothetical protein AAF664_11310 [Planctomycetota bacterium]